MYKFFRIFFIILSALAASSAILLGIFLGILYFFIAAGLAVFFFGICVLFKQLQERQEEKKNPTPFDNNSGNSSNLDATKADIEDKILQLQQNSTHTASDLDNSTTQIRQNILDEQQNSIQKTDSTDIPQQKNSLQPPNNDNDMLT